MHATAQSAATRELQALVGEARTRKDQREWLIVAVGFGIIVGMVLIQVLIAVLPWGGGDWLAGVMVGDRTPWQAGEVLMRDADPASFDKMAELYNTCGSRPVAFCIAAITLDEAAKARKGRNMETLPRPPKPPTGREGANMAIAHSLNRPRCHPPVYPLIHLLGMKEDISPRVNCATNDKYHFYFY